MGRQLKHTIGGECYRRVTDESISWLLDRLSIFSDGRYTIARDLVAEVMFYRTEAANRRAKPKKRRVKK